MATKKKVKQAAITKPYMEIFVAVDKPAEILPPMSALDITGAISECEYYGNSTINEMLDSIESNDETNDLDVYKVTMKKVGTITTSKCVFVKCP